MDLTSDFCFWRVGEGRGVRGGGEPSGHSLNSGRVGLLRFPDSEVQAGPEGGRRPGGPGRRPAARGPAGAGDLILRLFVEAGESLGI